MFIKCKMCGGDLVISPGSTICECEYCGSKQTIPNTDDEKRLKLYERANKLRFNCDFDKAAGVYESIVSEFQDEAEAYWGLVLCKYGIEYVDDPKTGKKIPTCHRSSFDSVMDDGNFELVMENADVISRGVYREEAKQIEELRKGIIEVSSKEEPYDIFICYKETDESGQRTIDSVIAQDVYDALIEEGYKVFFSRITLEEKLGQEYEPYIFAALNSAQVMLAFGTQYDYYNAVWVKNEWSRFLQLMESGQKKTLIPCYKNIDAYDMPKEFAKLQAQDMGKVGAIQDLIRGIKKIVPIGVTNPSIDVAALSTNGGGETTGPLLKRAFLFLEDGNFKDADEYCERVLDQEPENALAYLGKLMVETNVRKQEELADCATPFDASSNYQKAVRFGDEKLSSELTGYIDQINERNKNKQLSDAYEKATELMKKAGSSTASEGLYKSAAEKFSSITGYKDAADLAAACLELAEESRKDSIYNSAKQKMESGSISSVEEAIVAFQSIPEWKDSNELVVVAHDRITELNAKHEEERLERERKEEQARIIAEKAAQQRKRITIISITAVVAGVILTIVSVGIYKNVIAPKQKLSKAMKCIDAKDYDTAYDLLTELGRTDLIKGIKHDRAVELMELGDENEAFDLFSEIGEDEGIEKIVSNRAKEFLNADIGAVVCFGRYEQDNDESDGAEEIEWIVIERSEEGTKAICKYVLDCKQFNTDNSIVKWDESTLKKWIDEEFFNNAFIDPEKNMIQRISLPSAYDEVISDYLECEPTEYAKERGVSTSDGFADYWLRETVENKAFYESNGQIWRGGKKVNHEGVGVRPTILISSNE